MSHVRVLRIGLGPVAFALGWILCWLAWTPGLRAEERAGGLPLLFLEAPAGECFVARQGSMTVRCAPSGVDLCLASPRGGFDEVRLEILGADAQSPALGTDPAEGRIHMLRGGDLSRWQINGRVFGSVTYPDIYPGINLVVRGGSGLKAEWILAPGASPEVIRWQYRGACAVAVTSHSLRVTTAGGVLHEGEPLFWQEKDGERVLVTGGYREVEPGVMGFWVGDYDPESPLVLDPSLVWSTFLGGDNTGVGGESVRTIARDASGFLYVAGTSAAADFPVTPGALQPSLLGNNDAFVAKLDPTGSSLVWATYLGGTDREGAVALAVDGAGQVTLAGITYSMDFPATPGAFDTVSDATGGPQATGDVFVARLDATGSSLIWATYLGGTGDDWVGGSTHTWSGTGGQSLVLAPSGNVFLCGTTFATSFPVTAGAFDTTRKGPSDGYLVELDATGSQLLLGTLLGGADKDFATSLTLAQDGTAIVAGTTQSTDFPTTAGAYDQSYNGPPIPFDKGDAFIVQLTPNGSALQFGTYFGGSASDQAVSVALDPSGAVVIAGETTSPDLPTTLRAFDRTHNGKGDLFAARFDATGTTLQMGTYLGGGEFDRGAVLALDSVGNLYLGGSTFSPDFPTTAGSADTTFEGPTEGIVAKLDVSGRGLAYSSFLGGQEGDGVFGITVDSAGAATVVGWTEASFPTTPGAFDETLTGDTDGFVAQLQPTTQLTFNGTPAPSQSAHYTVQGLVVEAGQLAQVALSCSGQGGIPLFQGLTLPLTFDGCTQIGLLLGSQLQGTVDATGFAQTPSIAFPSVPPGITVWSAAFLWNPGSGTLSSVTLPLSFVTQ